MAQRSPTEHDPAKGAPTFRRKVMVIGSGPIVIGQAAEFDYAGSQACRSLRDAGLSVVLLNSNPATIMTDLNMADAVYLEPLTLEAAAAVIEKERPQGLLPTLGGQVGLNLAVELADAGVLDRFQVQLLGTPLETIRMAEDRQRFKETMAGLGQPLPRSDVARSVDEALAFAAETGYPVIVRPAFTLGGTGGGFAADPEELAAVARRGLRLSPVQQVLVEESVAGWKEIEYEVLRDRRGAAIIICGMENVDPCGVHTGDSIVTAPILTLSREMQQRLEEAALAIINTLGIEGGCNVQFAVHPREERYVVLEVNPRVSRSSALASKATGFPIAKVAALIATGRTLADLPHPGGRGTLAEYYPHFDYVVVKIPRWPFDKFHAADRRLGSQMKATGEVMAVGDTFKSALLKAVRSLELGVDAFHSARAAGLTDAQVEQELVEATDDRLFVAAEALRRGMPPDRAAALSGIDPWFIQQLMDIVRLERRLAAAPAVDDQLLAEAVRAGMGDEHIARVLQVQPGEITRRRQEQGLQPRYRGIGSGNGDQPAGATPYYYSTYSDRTGTAPEGSERPRVLVLGAGPIRIGQGIEFDYCTVHAVWALQRAGYEALIINNNPETVSTDFDTADRLFFEPLALDDVLNVIQDQKPMGVVTQFGGQTAINLAGPLAQRGVPLLGSPIDAIDAAEDRDKMDRLLQELNIPRPAGGTAANPAEAAALAQAIGYPVMVRPSYVLGGRGMEVVHDPDDLAAYITTAARVTPDHPLWVDAFVAGREVEVDAVCDGEQVLLPGIMEHVERAGVHSGDSTAVYPPRTLSPEVQEVLVDYTTRIALRLGIVGLLNIQFVVDGQGKVHVLEVNPRASRTVPFLSKVTGVPMVELATRAMLGEKLSQMGYSGGLLPTPGFYAVKMPVFSWAKLPDVDVALGPEMKSTGEAIGLDTRYGPALYRAFESAGFHVPHRGTLLASIADRDKEEALPVIRRFAALGFRLLATGGTAAFLQSKGLTVTRVAKLDEGRPHLVDHIRSGAVDLVLNTMTQGRRPQRDGFRIRRASTEHAIPCMTSLDTAAALVEALESVAGSSPQKTVRPLHQYLAHHPAAGSAMPSQA